ncbi:uncharacterized protein LOC144332737 isoform X4 [Macaca mulatta]
MTRPGCPPLPGGVPDVRAAYGAPASAQRPRVGWPPGGRWPRGARGATSFLKKTFRGTPTQGRRHEEKGGRELGHSKSPPPRRSHYPAGEKGEEERKEREESSCAGLCRGAVRGAVRMGPCSSSLAQHPPVCTRGQREKQERRATSKRLRGAPKGQKRLPSRSLHPATQHHEVVPE